MYKYAFLILFSRNILLVTCKYYPMTLTQHATIELHLIIPRKYYYDEKYMSHCSSYIFETLECFHALSKINITKLLFLKCIHSNSCYQNGY